MSSIGSEKIERESSKLPASKAPDSIVGSVSEQGEVWMLDGVVEGSTLSGGVDGEVGGEVGNMQELGWGEIGRSEMSEMGVIERWVDTVSDEGRSHSKEETEETEEREETDQGRGRFDGSPSFRSEVEIVGDKG